MSGRIVERYRELAPLLEAERRGGRTVALTNGCFDVLHVGHVRLLRGARDKGDILVVALNSDASARENKGEGRPHVPLGERMEIVAAISGVDFITSFDELTMSVFVASPATQTLPVRMYHHITQTIDPLIASISTVLIVLTFVVMIVLDRVYGLDRVLIGKG